MYQLGSAALNTVYTGTVLAETFRITIQALQHDAAGVVCFGARLLCCRSCCVEHPGIVPLETTGTTLCTRYKRRTNYYCAYRTTAAGPCVSCLHVKPIFLPNDITNQQNQCMSCFLILERYVVSGTNNCVAQTVA